MTSADTEAVAVVVRQVESQFGIGKSEPAVPRVRFATTSKSDEVVRDSVNANDLQARLSKTSVVGTMTR